MDFQTIVDPTNGKIRKAISLETYGHTITDAEGNVIPTLHVKAMIKGKNVDRVWPLFFDYDEFMVVNPDVEISGDIPTLPDEGPKITVTGK